MLKTKAALYKYLVLLLALVGTVSNLIFKIPDKNNTIILLIVFAAIYIFLSIAEFLNNLAKSHLPYERFSYLPFSVVGLKTIRLGIFIIMGTVLFLSQSPLIYLGSLVLIILMADLLVFVLRISKKVYYISLFANYILFALEDETKLFASQIEEIEYRYEIFYLKTKNKKAYPIVLARLPKQERAVFTEKLVIWVVCNKLNFTPEAKEKLADIISEAL